MKTQTRVPIVKIGVSRQVVIPKKIHDELGLAPGDYLGVERRDNKVVMTPKISVDRMLARRLAEGLRDIRRGRGIGPFDNAEEAIRALHAAVRRRHKK